jgi:PAS domain-containing protein
MFWRGIFSAERRVLALPCATLNLSPAAERQQVEEASTRANREEGARAAAEAAQVELRASRDQLAATLAGVAEGITVLDTAGQMLCANDAAARLCGFVDAQFGLTPVALAIIIALQPWLTGFPSDWALVIGLLIFVGVAFAPLALFVRAAGR